ncbi:MAG: hypothetical protein O3C40_15740 [Planctomycetota bacterium]|nr:hypothetical protein [Planctomycetota bacterium]
MSMYRTCGSRGAAAFALAIWTWLAVVLSTGGSLTSAQEPSTPSDAPRLPSVAPDLALLLARYQRTPARTRLASVPKMFGDSIGQVAGFSTLVNQPNAPPVLTTFGIPIGSSRASKVGDHNAALPVDRVYFNFNHFHNALDATFGVGPMAVANSASINRYVFGWERTFREGLWSVELRMPFTDNYGAAIPGPNAIASGGGNVGNLAIVLKRLVYETEDTVIAAGLVLDTPTGEDTFASIGPISYFVDNNVMGMLPYIGLLHVPDDQHFINAFLQTDIPLGDNTVRTADATGTPPSQSLGNFTQPTLLYLDVSAGYWLYRDPFASHLTGLAALLELHYTTTLHHGRALNGSFVGSNGTEPFTFGRRSGVSDVVNLTAAFNATLANAWVVRVGGIFPLGADNRFFDAEVAVQATRYF